MPTVDQLQRAIKKAQEAGDDQSASILTGDLQQKYAQGYSKASEAGDLESAELLASDYRATRGDSWSRDTANTDPMWLGNAKTLYKEVEKKDFKGDDAEASEWLKNYMGDFNYRLLGSEDLGLRNTVGIAMSVKDFSPKAKAAFLASMDDFDALPWMSAEGAGDAAYRVITDPSNLVGLGTGGGALAAKKGAQEAAKLGVKQLIKQGTMRTVKTAAAGAVEGAAYAGAGDIARQNAEINAGRGEEVDLGRAAKAAGTGAAVGTLAGTVAGELGAIIHHKRNKLDAVIGDLGGETDRGAMAAEAVLDLQARKDSPNNMREVVTFKEANALSDMYKDDAIELAKRSNLSPEALQKVKDATRKTKPRVLREDELDALSDTPEGEAVANAVRKFQVADNVTARDMPDGVFRRVGRFLLKRGIPVIGEEVADTLVPATNRTTRINKHVLSKENVAAARKLLDKTGPSKATQGLDTLKDSVAQADAIKASARDTKAKEKLQAQQQKQQDKDFRNLQRTARANQAVARDRLVKEGAKLEVDGKLSQDWLDKNESTLTGPQYRNFAKRLAAQKKALAKAQPKAPSGNISKGNGSAAGQGSRAGTTGPLVSAEFPKAGIKVEGEYKTGVRDRVLHENARRSIIRMEEDVLSHAKTLPEGGKLRTALETYVQSIRTDAKNDPASRDRLHAILSSKLSGEDAKAFAEQTEKLRKRFQKVTAEDAAEAVEKAK